MQARVFNFAPGDGGLDVRQKRVLDA